MFVFIAPFTFFGFRWWWTKKKGCPPVSRNVFRVSLFADQRLGIGNSKKHGWTNKYAERAREAFDFSSIVFRTRTIPVAVIFAFSFILSRSMFVADHSYLKKKTRCSLHFFFVHLSIRTFFKLFDSFSLFPYRLAAWRDWHGNVFVCCKKKKVRHIVRGRAAMGLKKKLQNCYRCVLKNRPRVT